MTSVALPNVQDDFNTGGVVHDADAPPLPKLTVDTDSLSSQASSQESTPNTPSPSEQLSPRPPSDLINYEDSAEQPPSRPESFMTWKSQISPIDSRPEMYQFPAFTTMSAPPGRKSQRKPAVTDLTILEEEGDALEQTRSPLQVTTIPEPDITFDGTDADKCCDLIHEIWTYAWKIGKQTDKRWIAEFAVTKFAKGVIAWYSRLPIEVKYDWDQLHSALIEAYGPPSPTDHTQSLIVPNVLRPTTPTPTQSTFSPLSAATLSTPSTATSSLMPITPHSTGGMLSPPLIYVESTEANGGRVSPEPPHHIPLPASPMRGFSCLHGGSGFNLTQQWQHGRLRVTNYTDRLHYVGLDLNTLGGCQTTSKKHEALCVKARLGDCRMLYLENSPPPHSTLGITWDMSKRHTPHLNRGSTDRANLVFMETDNTSSARVFRGRSKDAVWTIKPDNTVRVSWQDENQTEHELHVVVKAESMWSWPGRISLVADVDAFMTRHHGYIRSNLVFEPLA